MVVAFFGARGGCLIQRKCCEPRRFALHRSPYKLWRQLGSFAEFLKNPANGARCYADLREMRVVLFENPTHGEDRLVLTLVFVVAIAVMSTTPSVPSASVPVSELRIQTTRSRIYFHPYWKYESMPTSRYEIQ